MATERIEVQRTIPADARTIFNILCDPQGHVTIDSSGMLMDATGAPANAHSGPDQAADRPRYGYTLEPAGGGTLVTSYYDWSEIDPTWKDANIFPVISEGALRATLGILARSGAAS